MANAITITDPITIAIIEEEAQKRGLSPADTVRQIIVAHQPEQRDANRAVGARTETPEERAARLAEADRILSELQAMMTDEDRAFDYDAWLYDENGLPH